MKIIITILLALFISSQAYAVTNSEIISKGVVISTYASMDKDGYTRFDYIVLYKKRVI